jgi:hypothetical protein
VLLSTTSLSGLLIQGCRSVASTALLLAAVAVVASATATGRHRTAGASFFLNSCVTLVARKPVPSCVSLFSSQLKQSFPTLLL